jgi:hypothetical protein
MPPTRLRRHLIVYLGYLLLAVALTWPLVRVFSGHFIGDTFSDAYEYARHIWWMNHALRTGEPIFHQPLLGYPHGLGGAWLWGNPFQSFPAWLFALVMPLPAAYNLAALLTLALNGWSAYFLVWRLTRHVAAALLAGSIFLLYPTVQGHLIASHTGLLVLWGVPLYALGLLGLRGHHALTLNPSPEGRGTSQHIGILVTPLAFLVSVLGNNLLLVYALFPVSLVMFAWAIITRAWGWAARIVSVAALGGVLALVFIGPVALEQLDSPLSPEGGDVLYSADLLAVVAPSFYNPLFSDLTYSRSVLGGVNNVEGTAYVGLVPAVLALLALWRVPAARPWGLLALVAWMLSLGPLLKVAGEPLSVTVAGVHTHIVLPWALLMDLPVLNIARTPARFNFVVGLAVAVLGGYGAAWVLDHNLTPKSPLRTQRAGWGGKGLRWTIVVALVTVIAFEYHVSWRDGWPHLHTTPYPDAAPLVALMDEADVEAVLNLPYDHLLAAKGGMILQTRHERPLIAGHVTRRTPVDPARLATLQWTLDPALLDAANAEAVILHRRWDNEDGPGAVEENAIARLGGPAYSDDDYLLWLVPDPTEPAPFLAVPQGDRLSVYAPSSGWATLTVNDSATRLPLASGYTLLDRRPPGCPDAPDPALDCDRQRVRDLTLTDFAAADTPPITFGGTITLYSYEIQPDALHLAWAYMTAPPENWARFVVVLDADGNPALQDDQPTRAPYETILLDALPPGDYTVYVGWYTLPDVTRLAVRGDVPGTESSWAQLGEVAVE